MRWPWAYLKELEDLVLAEVLVGLAEELVVAVGYLQGVAHLYCYELLTFISNALTKCH